MLPSRKDGVRDAGALLVEGLETDFEGWSFHRLDIEGKRRLIREANDSLLRSLVSCRLEICSAERSKSSPGVHSGFGETTLDRDSWLVWCMQKGVSPTKLSAHGLLTLHSIENYICIKGRHHPGHQGPGLLWGDQESLHLSLPDPPANHAVATLSC